MDYNQLVNELLATSYHVDTSLLAAPIPQKDTTPQHSSIPIKSAPFTIISNSIEPNSNLEETKQPQRTEFASYCTLSFKCNSYSCPRRK